MNLFREESDYPKINAQRNLRGRTYYVDDDTLRWHKSRVLRAKSLDHGLLFYIITSDALNYENTKRGYRFVIFDVFGTEVLDRPDLEHAFASKRACEKAMWIALNEIDAKAHTLQAIEQARQNYESELQRLRETVDALQVKQAA